MSETVVSAAQSAVGVVPYKWARPINPGVSLARLEKVGADCSGLLMWAYHQAGIHRLDGVHWTVAQYHVFQTTSGLVAASEAMPGDAIFYSYKNNGKYPPDHVAINVGGGQLIEAPEPGLSVRTRSWSPTDPYVMRWAGKCPSKKERGGTVASGGFAVKVPPWLTYSGKPYHAPPGGTYRLLSKPPKSSASGLPSNVSAKLYPASKDSAVFTWLAGYYDDGSFTSSYGKTFATSGMTHDALGSYYALILASMPRKSAGYQGAPDQGKAVPGVGPISWKTDLGTLLHDLLDPHTWLRIFEFAVGALLLGVGLAHLTGNTNPVSKLAGKVNPL